MLTSLRVRLIALIFISYRITRRPSALNPSHAD